MGSTLPDRALGMLKNEMLHMGSMIIQTAFRHALPAGSALAVGREDFAQAVTTLISNHPNIELIRQEITEIPEGPTIMASGPLTSSALIEKLQALTGQKHLYFYDAMSPIVTLESVDMTLAFRQSRYDKDSALGQEGGDYINCPFNKDEYEAFVNAVVAAPKIELKAPDKELERYFEGCMPIEVLAGRGLNSLAFGPMRPVGLRDPRSDKRPHAVVQLRQDNLAGSLYNMVGFQTNLKFPEQKRVLRLIPGLENAEFLRYGQMHRNTFIASPKLLRPTLQHNQRDDLFFAGQITGVEGYMGNIATGLLAGINAARLHQHEQPLTLPQTTMLGALCHYVTHADLKDFQPMKANFGILPSLNLRPKSGKRERGQLYANRALKDLELTLSDNVPAAVVGNVYANK